jgi:hypothetical protein
MTTCGQKSKEPGDFAGLPNQKEETMSEGVWQRIGPFVAATAFYSNNRWFDHNPSRR